MAELDVTALVRLRIAAVAAMGVVLAITAGEVFDEIRWSLVVGPVLVGLAAVVALGRRWAVQLASAAAAVVLGAGIVVVVADGGIGDLVASFTSGPQRLLSTDWPSPRRADLVGTVEALLTSLVAVAAILASRRRLHLAPLVPIGFAFVLVVAGSAPGSPHLGALAALVLLGSFLALLRTGTDLPERLALIRGERWVPALLATSLLVVVGVGAAGGLDERADPRRNDPPERTATLLDPIEATVALQEIDPPVALYEIEVDDGGRLPRLWRTASLSVYDGRRWAPNLELRPIGRRIGAEIDSAVSVTIRFLDDDLQLVPLPGPGVIVEAAIDTDPERSLVRLIDRPTVGAEVNVLTGVDPGVGETPTGAIGTREVDETVSGLTDFATAFVERGAGSSAGLTVLEQLDAIETVLAEEYELDSDASGGGVQRVLIDRFLRDTERGNREQFVTAFVLLARSLGIDARVATGFEVDAELVDATDSGFAFPLTSADATLWPEVRTADGWLPFDPVPDDEASDIVDVPPEPQVQAPTAPQPPIADPPEVADEPVVTEQEDVRTDSGGLPVVVQVLIRVSAGVGLALVPLLAAVALVLGLKRRQRRRRLSGSPLERISGAWSVATNRLVDAGMAIDTSATNGEIARAGTAVAPAAQWEMGRLSSMASAATFGRPARADLLADDAQALLAEIEASISADRTRWQRVRWRLSMRSLRRATRSPV